jgi:hypothetical protein
MTRRDFLAGGATGLGAAAYLNAANGERWDADWDNLLIRSAVRRLDAQYDPREKMLVRRVGPEYNYHSTLRSREAHPTRESLTYALLLLETGETGRSAAVLDRVMALQETATESKWYGLWGYYLEEPPPRMSPADWNWADFNGATLVMIEARHGAKLEGTLRARVRSAIEHAANSVRLRNVPMTYTNIAVQGSFVVMAAAELSGDGGLRGYATDRWRRFVRHLDSTGSFDEYNSPTYGRVTIENLTRMGMVIRDEEFLRLAQAVHERAWLHLARHWHAPTRQLAGPMSRSYSTDIGRPLWIQKSLNGRLPFWTRAELQESAPAGEGETGMLEFACPESLAGEFLDIAAEREHRELFIAAEPPVRPVQGTTWLGRTFTIGSVNRGDFWVQRRPLVAYWGGPGRPARYAQLRVMKDDYDFSSALLYSTQKRNCVLGIVNFRNPGGDKHISLDPIANGEFTASRLRARLDLAGVAPEARLLVNGKPADRGALMRLPARVAIDAGGAFVWFWAVRCQFGAGLGQLRVAGEDGVTTVSVDFLNGSAPQQIRWAGLRSAFLAFAMTVEEASGDLAKADLRVSRRVPALLGKSVGQLTWDSPAGRLSVTASLMVDAIIEQDRVFQERVDGKVTPVVRLSDSRILGA